MYKIGRIYRIICLSDPTIQYVGSTFNELRHRWQQHKKCHKYKTSKISIYEYFDKHGIDNFKIILIKEFQVVDKPHLRAYEQLYINKLKCVNKYNPFSITYLQQKSYITKTDFNKKWYEKNKVKSSEKAKKYREKNKEKLKAYNKEYYKKNKEKILATKKASTQC